MDFTLYVCPEKDYFRFARMHSWYKRLDKVHQAYLYFSKDEEQWEIIPHEFVDRFFEDRGDDDAEKRRALRHPITISCDVGRLNDKDERRRFGEYVLATIKYYDEELMPPKVNLEDVPNNIYQ